MLSPGGAETAARFSLPPLRLVLAVVASALVVAWVTGAVLRVGDPSDRYHMRLVDVGDGNEVLLMEAQMPDGEWSLFQVDTAYAGPPVLSLSYLHTIRSSSLSAKLLPRGPARSAKELAEAYSRIVSAPSPEGEDMWRAVSRFLSARSGCRSYTSGCSVRLMGIGETTEAQSSLFLCPPLAFDRPSARRGATGTWDADVLMTHPLHAAPHILTIDYLLHRSPCVLELSKGLLRTGVSLSSWEMSSFTTIPSLVVGGAFVIEASVGGGAMRLVVDTGSSGTISIGRSSAAKIRACAESEGGPKTVTQVGVHGETVCSDLLVASVVMGRTTLPGVDIMVNSSEVEAADGYMGLALLRAFDIYVEHGKIAFRKNGLPVARVASATRSERCASSSSLPPCAASEAGPQDAH